MHDIVINHCIKFNYSFKHTLFLTVKLNKFTVILQQYHFLRGEPSPAAVMVYPPSLLHYYPFELPWPGLAPLVLAWRSQ